VRGHISKRGRKNYVPLNTLFDQYLETAEFLAWKPKFYFRGKRVHLCLKPKNL
jgi:hypothetical protein